MESWLELVVLVFSSVRIGLDWFGFVAYQQPL